MEAAESPAVVVVTGAAQGIGRAVAGEIAATGRAVAALDRDASGVADTCELIRAKGGSAAWYVVDVAERSELGAVRDQILADLGEVEGLVNNAGVVSFGGLRDVSPEEWARVHRVNSASALWVAQTFLTDLAARRGAIVNVASIAAFAPSPTTGPYSVSKAAIAHLTRQMAVEWGPLGVRANAVAPGLISGTGMTQVEEETDGLRDARAGIVPLGRTGRPEEVAAVVSFLLSDASRYVSGQVLLVDGALSVSLLTHVPRPAEQWASGAGKPS